MWLGGLHWSALLSPRSFVGDECPIEEIHTAAPASSLVQGILSSSDATQAVADGFTSLKQVTFFSVNNTRKKIILGLKHDE